MSDLDDGIVTGGALRGSIGAEVAQQLGLRTRFVPGDLVGPFRLISELGEGGSSVVFLAARDNGTFEQEVALKLWRDASSAQRAVVAESNLLGRLNHPNIARIIDAGLLNEQDAWLAMAYIEGQHIDQAATSLNADWRQRLSWLRTIALSVHYAHQQWIAHGDIKPSNVMIDRNGQPCLLDFGIAQHMHWQEGSGGCTPGYASPEQLRGDPISAASDVYQLGKLVATLLPATLAMPAPIRGALAAILSKALAIEPAARHESAKALAQDLERLRQAEAPDGLRLPWSQRLGLLWLRRAPALVGSLILLMLASVLGWQWQREQAQANAQIARQQSAKNELARLNAALMVEALRSVGGEQDAFRNFVRGQQAQTLAESRLDPWVKYEILSGLAAAHVETTDYDEARFVVQQALALRQTMHQPDDLGVAYLHCLDAISAAVTGRIEEARRRAHFSSMLLQRFNAQDPELTFRTQTCLSGVHIQVGDVAQAGKQIADALAFAEKRYGSESREYVEAMIQSAEVARVRMDFKQARQFNEYASARLDRWFGEHSRRSLEQFIRLQGTRAEAGEPESAEQALSKVVTRLREQGLIETYPYHAANYYRAEALQLLGRYDEAAASFRTAIEMMGEGGMEAPSLHRLSDVAAASRMDLERGQAQAAIDAHRAVLEFSRNNEADPVLRSVIMIYLADALLERGDTDLEVDQLLNEAEPVIKQEFGPDSFHALLLCLQRIRFLLATGQDQVAQQRFESAKTHELDVSIPAHARLMLRWQLLQVALQARRGEQSLALQSATSAIAFASRQFGSNHPLTAVARVMAADSLGAQALAWQAMELRKAEPVLLSTHPADSRYRRMLTSSLQAVRALAMQASRAEAVELAP